MTSSRFSEFATAAVLVSLLVAAVAPAVAVPDDNVKAEQMPDEVAVGSDVEAVFVITGNLYNDPAWNSWLLKMETGLNNVTWTVTYLDVSGKTIDQFSVDGANVTVSDHPVAKNSKRYDATIAKVRVKVTGTAPAVGEFHYESKEQLLIAQLTQVREGGSSKELGAWRAYHYTEGTDEKPGSKEARQEIRQARRAIENASKAGADVGGAKSTLDNAIEAYDKGEFELAVDLANKAERKAEKAKKQEQQSQQTTKLLMYGGVGLVLLLLIGGGVYYWRNQGDDYDKLG